MRFVAWVKKREKAIAPSLLAAAAVLWVTAVGWHVLDLEVPLLSLDAAKEVYKFGLGGETGKPLDDSLLHLASLLGKGGAVLAAVYAYLKVLDIGLDRLALRFLYRNHVIIVGLGEKARRLATNIQAAGCRVALIERNDSHPIAPILRAQGVAVVHGDGLDRETLHQAAIQRASTLVCLTESDAVNLEVAHAASEIARTSRRRTPLRCIVHVADRSLRQIASEAPHYRCQEPKFDGRVVDVVDIAARGALTAYPPEANALVNSPGAPALHVLVVGADALARAIVVNIALQAHYVTAHRPVVTLLDPAATQAAVQLLAEYPALSSLLELRAQDVSLQHLSSLHLLECTGQKGSVAVSNTPTIATAYITLERDVDALAAGMHLARLVRGWDAAPMIAVCMPPESNVLASVGAAKPGEPLGFATFDRYSICSAEYFLGEALDAKARARHQAYLDQIVAQGQQLRDKPTQRPWAELDEMVKASNRRQVEHEGVKRRALQAVGHGAEALESLAEMEHRRWMADMLMSGWSYGARYDARLLRHNNIVPYDQLDEATREYDREVIRKLVATTG